MKSNEKFIIKLSSQKLIIKLSTQEFNGLTDKAKSHELAPEDIIRDFINNLLCTDNSLGDNEQKLANDYFKACYDMYGKY